MFRILFALIWILFFYGLGCYLLSLRRYGSRFVETSIAYDLYSQLDNVVNNYDGTMNILNGTGRINPYKIYIRWYDFVSPYIIAFKRNDITEGEQKGQEVVYYRRVVIFSSLYFKIRDKK